MRQAAASVSAMPDVTTDWAALIDTWAVRFLHEMDYTREATNGELFRCVLQNDMVGACVVVLSNPLPPFACW
jgi:predicted unusual protein kinase regulating ubiquinone biosynthesis (AarF/ABC1/UbiB family)